MPAQSLPLNPVLIELEAQHRIFFAQPKSKCLDLFETILICSLVFFSILGAVLLACLYHPRMNTLPSYTVSSATVDPFNISSLRLTAAWNISFYIKNYNTRRELKLNNVQSSIYYGSHLLSQVSIPPFYVHKSGHLTIRAHLESLDVDVAESMVKERLLHGAVDFRVELLARANYMRISCENVTVGFPVTDNVGPGIMLGPPRKYKIFVDEKPKKRQ